MKSSSKEKEYINFDKLKEFIKISNQELFLIYLREIFKDLSSRSDKKSIGKMTFYDYFKMPIFLSEKLFSAFDKDNDGLLSMEEFVKGIQDLYTGDFDKTVSIIFRMLDFDKDGFIQKEDVKLLLSYLPLKTENSRFQYEFQMESLNEIDDIIAKTFKDKKSLTIDEFKSAVETRKSDIYLQILCYLYLKVPFTDDCINNLQSSKKKIKIPDSYKLSKSSSPNLLKSGKSEFGENDEGKTLLLSPSKRTSFSPVVQLLSNTPGMNKKQPIEQSTPVISGMGGMLRFNNEKISKDNNCDNIEEAIKNSKDFFQSPSKFLRNLQNKEKKDQNVEADNKLDEIEDLVLDISGSSDSNNNENEESSDSSEKRNSNSNSYENWVYKLSDEDNLKKYYLVIVDKDVFYYKTEKKDTLFGMHNLSGCFIKDNGEKTINKTKFYCFQIIYPNKIKNYYTTEKEIMNKFIITVKTSLGYLNFFDFYEMGNDLGKGRFGKVKLGIHKSTGQHVAIKIIKKTAMSQSDGELVKSEIDIMKLCHHPNIVHLLDHFENAEYIFIVMEYLSGGDLDNYLRKQKSLCTERRAADIMFQLCSGIQYLHQYGIVHRDLKPENIMLTEPTDNAKIKIMDFGLSKIMGPGETALDGFGTLNFVAPEVLLRTPYNKSIDIWSIGITLYYLLSGRLPFDDSEENEERIANLTVFEEVQFPEEVWGDRSSEVIDLITKCLIKDPEKRLKIEEVLDHEWFQKNNKKRKTNKVNDDSTNYRERFKSKKKLEIII